MAKQRKQKPGAEGAGESVSETGVIARHQKVCVAFDMEHQAFVGHTEIQAVVKRGGAVELHSGGAQTTHVHVDGEAATFETKRRAVEARVEPKTLEDAAKAAFSRYTSMLEEEEQADLLVTLPSVEPVKPSPAENEEVSKQLVVRFFQRKPMSKLLFRGNTFQTSSVQYWFPCVGSTSSKCSYRLELTVNCDYFAVSSGKLLYQVVSKVDPRLRTFVFELNRPTCPSFVTLVIAPLQVLPERQNPSLAYLCSPGYISKLQATVSCYHSLFSLYEEYLGCSFPYETYTQVFIQSEHTVSSVSVGASVVTFSSHLLVDERVIDEAILTQIKLAQALSQQWFGVFVTPETDQDVWLLEGLSGFLVQIFIRKSMGNNEALFRKSKAFAAVTDADIECFAPLRTQTRLPTGVHRAEKRGMIGKLRTSKAVAVMQMLEKQMGSDHFRKVLQRIVLQARDSSSSTLSTKEFRRLAEKTGNLERPFLKLFFPRWVECQGCPFLRMGFEYNKKRNLVEFAVHRDCTAPDVLLAGNKSIADVGWPGMMNIQIHELDGTYDHPNLSLSGDVHQLLEIPCHSKMANRRAQRPKKPGKVEIIDDLADDKPSVESPLLFIRADPLMDYLAKIQLRQPEQMWINQLEKEKDIVAQVQAISALQKLPNSFPIVNALNGCLIDSKVYCRVRIEAAFALGQTASEATSWTGLTHLMKFFKSRCFDPEISLPKPNNFHDFHEYFVLQAVPPAIAAVRSNQGKSPPEAVEFILSILKHNDNNGNTYSDSHWLSSVIESVGELEIGQHSMPKFTKILKQIDRYLQNDRLMPSHNNILTRSCIRTLMKLALKFTTVLPLEPLEKLLSPFKNVHISPWQVRVAALHALMDMKFQSQGLNATLRLAVSLVNDDPCTRVQVKVMAHVLKICLRHSVASSVVDGPTVVSLLETFNSEACVLSSKLRHLVFSVLQVLARKPATLIWIKTPLKTDLREDASKLKLRVTIPKPEQKPAPKPEPKVGKLTLRVRPVLQNAEARMTSTSPSPAPAPPGPAQAEWPEVPRSGKSESENTDQPQGVKGSTSSSNQVASNQNGVLESEKVEVSDDLETPNSQLKNVVEIIDIPETKASESLPVATTSEQGGGEVHRHKKRDKEKKKEKRDKKHKDKDRKDRKEKKEKHRDKEKKHKKRKHDEIEAEGTANGGSASQAPSLLQVKQEIADASTGMTCLAPVVTPKPVHTIKLKFKRAKVE